MPHQERKSMWFFGGLASVGAAMVTHPLDLIKVTLQTQQGHLSVAQLIPKLAREQGVLVFYNGLSASVLRQLTYSTARFGVYEAGKKYVNTDSFGVQFFGPNSALPRFECEIMTDMLAIVAKNYKQNVNKTRDAYKQI